MAGFEVAYLTLVSLKGKQENPKGYKPTGITISCTSYTKTKGLGP